MGIKTPLTYYGGKQALVPILLPLIPDHDTYVEPFVGGGALFWTKEPSKVEVINDNNRELINFYEIVQNEFVDLEKMIRISLHSRSLYNDATVIYNNPHLFNRIKRAWAVWILASQAFCSKFNGSWGYEKTQKKISGSILKKREGFTEDYAIRLQSVQIECTDALRVIRSRDHAKAFHYCDPPYFNSHCGHYNGYNEDDFNALLQTLEAVQGKFLLSSYPSDLLLSYTQKNSWNTQYLEKKVSVSVGLGVTGKRKIEVLTGNYNLDAPNDELLK
ncbi:DNA adenine methylase [Chryseobacterium viscerum]|uniref:site-specific DNA-methyltransferase (adenine-specific) n=1 Tax=Chryseobacterium viscerum TaxID=1037377 RepID=A0A316WRW3_9FLAO|nr:DNA adenine methylase [Chryseobacterium viscerum]PWN64192.1 DNA adenine methylase [Chryseobacterium viscerum]